MTPEEKRLARNAYMREYYERDPEKTREYRHNLYLKHKLDPNFTTNAYYERHKDDPEVNAKRRDNAKKWREDNPEQYKKYQREYKKARYKPKKKPKEKDMKKKKQIEKNCYNCDNCEYVGIGGYMCGVSNDIVIEDWQPTENFTSCNGKEFKKI